LVNNFLFKDRDGQTPLPIELQRGLKLKHIQTVGELDEYEEDNIVEGLLWLRKQRRECTKYDFWIKLHKKLFENVWDWAGEIRKHELNNPYFYMPQHIWPAFKKLEDDLAYWLKEKTYLADEIAARFHEQIETIHPFANGNGRFGRILVEYFCLREKTRIPTWGAARKDDPIARRKQYIAALDSCRQNKSYAALIAFMFS